MKLLGKFLAITCKPFDALIHKWFPVLSFEKFLQNAFQFLDEESINEIGKFLQNQQTSTGGFRDRAGNESLYYSLFGFFVAKALNDQGALAKLEAYVSTLSPDEKKSASDVYCATILLSQLTPELPTYKVFSRKVRKQIRESQTEDSYGLFLGLVTLFYQNNYARLTFLLFRFKSKFSTANKQKPTSILSAELIIAKFLRKKTEAIAEQLGKHFRPSGGFAALANTPIEDLLSTAVALFALKLTDTNLDVIRPEALNFIDEHYDEGGFVATLLDPQPDIEYTFYGLLALAALH